MIYADYNGSAPLCQEVKDFLIKRLNNDGPYANPNAIHFLGGKVLMNMEKARTECARILGASASQLFFNSGSSEGVSQVFYSLLSETPKHLDTMIISGIEHSAVINAGNNFQKKGFKYLTPKTLKNGLVDINDLKKLLDENKNKVAIVAIMAANNETGVIQPYHEVALLCEKYQAPYFCDTTQLIGKGPFNFKESKIDYAVMSGHKIGALTGTGILLAKNPIALKELIFGGGQEKGLRGGTQNYLGNETMAIALQVLEKNFDKLETLRVKKEEFESQLKKEFNEIVILGEDAPRLASTTFISYPGIHGQGVQIELESQNIFVTTSSACSDNEPVTSKVLKAMGVNDQVGRGAVRISLGLCSPGEYYQDIFKGLSNAYKKLSKIKSF